MSFVCDHQMRVRYAETDQMGLVYYGNYFIYFEIGRVEFCRSAGVHYRDLEKEEQCFLTVAEASCRYQRSLVYDMEFIVRTTLTAFRGSFLLFEYEILSGSDRFARGRTKHVVTGPDGRVRQIPSPYSDCLRRALT